MLHGKEEPPITIKDGIALKRVLNSFVFWNWVWEKSYYKGGHYNWLKVCNQMLNLYTKHPHTSAKTANLTTPSPLLSCWVRQCRTWREALPHRGTTTLRAALPHLSVRWSWEGIYTHPLSPQRLSFSSCQWRTQDSVTTRAKFQKRNTNRYTIFYMTIYVL